MSMKVPTNMEVQGCVCVVAQLRKLERERLEGLKREGSIIETVFEYYVYKTETEACQAR